MHLENKSFSPVEILVFDVIAVSEGQLTVR